MRSLAVAVVVAACALASAPASAERAPRADAAAAGTAGALEVSSSTTGADVAIDGETVGHHPAAGGR